ncbi:hypothetical protein [Vulgatibacter sp.]|uniref:hypothetical protein n=1 Tax=Vulgatibacter sp. TaxID=1971226 RepID=UPI0035683C05
MAPACRVIALPDEPGGTAVYSDGILRACVLVFPCEVRLGSTLIGPLHAPALRWVWRTAAREPRLVQRGAGFGHLAIGEVVELEPLRVRVGSFLVELPPLGGACIARGDWLEVETARLELPIP